MGSKQHRQQPPRQEQAVFQFKQMISKRQAVSPHLYYQFLEPLCICQFSEVHKVRSMSTGHLRVIKKLPKLETSTATKRVVNQYQILRQLDHPNIIRMYEIFQDQANIFIVTQLVHRRDSLEMLEGRKTVPQQAAFGLFYQTLLAIKYLHMHNIMHRDIKLENIIYDQTNNILKLIDFGSALKFGQNRPKQRRLTGTIHYMAPQVFNQYYDSRCDIWSLGVVLYILLCGNAPFTGQSHAQITKIKFQQKVWSLRSDEVQDLLLRLLNKNMEKRICIQQIFQHPWVVKQLSYVSVSKQQKQSVKIYLQKMMRFKNLRITQIQLAILLFMLNFVEQEKEQIDIVHAFWAVNLSRNGQIREYQLTKALINFLAKTQKEAQQIARDIMLAIDINNSGDISFSEFCLATTDLRQLLTTENLQKTFRYIDTDGSSSLSAKQLQSRLGSHLDQGYYTRVVKYFDQNGDGQIDRVQFSKMMKDILKYY